MAQKEPQTMAELLAANEKPFVTLKRRQVLDATVLSINPREIILDLGGKAEGVVSGRELESEAVKNLKVGDVISVTIMQTDTDNDYIICSLQIVSDTSKYTQVNEALDNETTLPVQIIEDRKGGFLVNFNGIRGFLPSSQVAIDYIGKQKEMIGKTFDVKVIEFDADAPRLIVSQKQVVSEDEKEKRRQFFDTTKVGDSVTGTVVAVLPFGIVVNVNGVEGFVHISEIAWERVENPSSYYKVADKLTAAITSINQDEGKITLSVKQLSESPWSVLSEKFAQKEQVSGNVTKQTSQGYLVRLDNGVIGLIHKSQLGDKTLAEGDAVICIIETIDLEKKRLNLILAITK